MGRVKVAESARALDTFRGTIDTLPNTGGTMRHVRRTVLGLTLLLPLAAAIAAAGSRRAPDPEVSTDIPVLTILGFRPVARGDLFPAPEPTVSLVIPRVYASRTNAEMKWYVEGVNGEPHPVLRGRERFQRYKEVLRDLILQTRNPAVGDLLRAADALLDGVEPETRLGDVAKEISGRAEARAEGLPRHAVLSLEERAAWLAAAFSDVAVGNALQNGTLRVLLLDALHDGVAQDRITLLEELTAAGAIGADPVYAEALRKVIGDLSRSAVLRREMIQELFRFALDTPSLEPLGETTVPLLPMSLVTDLFGDRIDAEALGRIGLDASLQIQKPVTRGEFLRVEADLILIATLWTDLTVAEDGRPLAVRLRLYAERLYHETLSRLLESVDDAFVTQLLGWRLEAPAEGAASRFALLDGSRVRVAGCDRQLILLQYIK